MSSRSLRAPLAGLSILVLLAGLVGPVTPGPASAADKIAPEVLAPLHGDGQGVFLVYLAEQADLGPAYRIRDWDRRGWFVLNALRQVAGRTQPAVLAALNELHLAGHVSAVRPYYVVNLIAVRGDEAAARSIARLPGVAAVYANVPIVPVAPEETAPTANPQTPEWNIQKIRADQVWSIYGVDGTGIVVANIDSGVQYSHPALVEQYRGCQDPPICSTFDHEYNWWDPSDQYDYPAPISGPYPLGSSHGTHTMGVIVGDDGLGNQIGVAPGARWIAAYGFSGFEGLLSATEWMIAPWQVNDFDPGHPTADPSKRPHTVNNSWGAPGGVLLFNPLLEAQRAAGIFPTFAGGNSGTSGCGTLIAPADNPAGFGVGATDTNDNIAFFSSRGPNALQPWLDRYGIGPEVSAPGHLVRTCTPGGGYSIGSGTSYASPHVAGTVALLWSAEPDIVGRVEETKAILRGTAVPRMIWESCGGVPGSEVPNNTYGWGRIDALAAVQMIYQAGTLAGTISEAGTGAAVPAARVLMQRDDHTLRSDSDAAGEYNFPLGQGSYTVTVQAYGYETWTASEVDVQQDLTTTLDVALTPLPTHTLSGVVSEGMVQAAGDPVWALLGLQDTPISVTTDPVSGIYSTPAAEGDYWLRVVARGYVAESRAITVTGDLTESFALEPRWTYYVRDSRSACGPAFNWVDATDGTPHYIGFQEFFSFQEPAYPFTFYGDPHSTYYVSSNGLLTFGQGHPQYVQDLPAMVVPYEGPPNDVIYAFGDILDSANGTQGNIYHQVVEDRYVVVEFHQVEHWTLGMPETFEFVLDTETGVVLLQYLEVNWPDIATVGVESWDGFDGIMYSFANSAGITDSLAVAFYPVFGPPPAEQDEAGVLGTLSGTVYVSGTTRPIHGALVTASTFLRTLTTTTDAAGRYRFSDICADLYWLQARSCFRSDPVQARMRWPGDVVVTDFFLEPCPPYPALTKTVTPTQVQYAGSLTYTLSYANQGDGDIVGAVLSDTLPWIVGYITSTPPGFYQDGTLTWTVDISGQGAGEVTIVGFLIPPPAGAAASGGRSNGSPYLAPMITNTAYLSWEGLVISDSASFEAIWVPWLAPALTKTVALTRVQPGELLTYTLSYANKGYGDLYGAVLSDTLPEEVAYITSTPPGLYQDGRLTWTVNISAGGAGEVAIVGQLSPTVAPGVTVSNTAYLLWWAGPALSSTASFQVELPCQEVQSPSIQWAPSWPQVGQEITFSGTVALGDPPITFTWAFGDGAFGQGTVVTHSYTLGGSYTVVLTAANCAGAGLAVVSETLAISPYRIYLPIVSK